MNYFANPSYNIKLRNVSKKKPENKRCFLFEFPQLFATKTDAKSLTQAHMYYNVFRAALDTFFPAYLLHKL